MKSVKAHLGISTKRRFWSVFIDDVLHPQVDTETNIFLPKISHNNYNFVLGSIKLMSKLRKIWLDKRDYGYFLGHFFLKRNFHGLKKVIESNCKLKCLLKVMVYFFVNIQNVYKRCLNFQQLFVNFKTLTHT